jgi:integrase
VLSDIQIRKLKSASAMYRLTDGGGLYLAVTPMGGKLWRWKYRYLGAEKLMSLGKYPDVTIADARQRHADARKVLAAGVDPMAKRKADKAARMASADNSFKTVAELWLSHWGSGKSARHVDTTRRRLESNVFPVIGPRPIAEIEAPELVEMVKKVESRGAVDLAKRALETTGQIFRYAIAHGQAKRNPAADIRPRDILRPTRKANFARIEAKELPALLRAIEVYRGKVITRLAIKFLALTFVRTGELIGARWEEIDLGCRRWKIAAERMKMKTPHIVPLADQALELLGLLHTLTGNREFLFPGDVDHKKPMSNNTILCSLKRMGYGGVMTGHGFRGLASTLLHEQGWPHEHIELQLSHTPRNAVSAAYNHALYLEPRKTMMQHWANFLERTQRVGKPPSFHGDSV